MMVPRKQGSILILALWVLFFLAALTVAAAGHVWAVLQAAERLQSRALGRMEAASVAAWTVAVLEEYIQAENTTNVWDGVATDAWNRDPRLFSLPSQGLPSRSEDPAVYFMLPDTDDIFGGILGESGRLHLNRHNPEMLKHLFAYVGGEPGAQVAQRLFAVRESGGAGLTGRGNGSYDRIVFRTVEDLRMIEGVDADLYAKLAPHLTVYGGKNVINVNSATRAVLVAYFVSTDDPEMVRNAEELADQVILERRDRGFMDREDFLSRMPDVERGIWARGPMGVVSTAFRGIAVGGEGSTGAGMEIEFVWDTITRQYVVWRER